MPGAMVTKQVGTYLTTKDLDLEKAGLTFIANRDENGHASMTLYLDDGESLVQPDENYAYQLNANSLI